MARSTKDAWLQGPGDLKETDVEDVPVKGQSVRVRGLPAAFSNQASSEALELQTGKRGQQTATINTAELEIIQFHHGVLDPKFTLEEARVVSQKYGPAFKKIIAKIDELSGVDKADIERTEARFPGGGASEARANGGPTASTGSGEPAVHARAGD